MNMLILQSVFNGSEWKIDPVGKGLGGLGRIWVWPKCRTVIKKHWFWDFERIQEDVEAQNMHTVLEKRHNNKRPSLEGQAFMGEKVDVFIVDMLKSQLYWSKSAWIEK